MTDTIAHRGPDDQGGWTDEASGVALGHRRLSIVDLSAEGHQPMTSRGGRYVMIFNGEIYNFRALRDELAASGASFRGHSDTEVMLAAFERWGIADAMPRFAGMFSFAVWDREERALTLVRDRMGEKPLYYGWSGDTLLFGSELKALRAHPAWNGEIDRGALALFLRHNYVPGPYSIYRGIQKLAPGTMATIREGARPGQAIVTPYWSPRAVAEQGMADPLMGRDEELIDLLDAVLRNTIREEMVADVPLGAFLSGGVDSSLVVALMQAEASTPVRTFTIGFHDEGLNEAEHAKAVARHLGTQHTELYVTAQQTLDVIPRLPQMYDEPFADSSQVPTFLVAQLARQHVTVSLSGDGGDELFGGYNRYFWSKSLWPRLRRVPRPVRAAVAAGISAVSPDRWNRLASGTMAMLPPRYRVSMPGDKLHKLAGVLAVASPEEMYRELVSHWRTPDQVVLAGGEHPSVLADRASWTNGSDYVSRMMYLDMITYLPDDILVKVDRATMGVSLEARAPFLDHRVVELAWRLPMHVKVRDGKGKWILRQLLDRYVPRTLIERPKMGFAVPLDTWLRGPLRDWGESLLAEDRLRNEGYFDPAAVRRKWAEHQGGQRNWQYLLWDVLMFQAWHEAQC